MEQSINLIKMNVEALAISKVKLTGKILQVPVNGYELKELEKGAKKMGLPLGSYLRTLGLEAAEKY